MGKSCLAIRMTKSLISSVEFDQKWHKYNQKGEFLTAHIDEKPLGFTGTPFLDETIWVYMGIEPFLNWDMTKTNDISKWTGAQEHFDTFMEWMRTGVRVHHHLLLAYGLGRDEPGSAWHFF